MRVAAIYDIHGNLPALESVIEEIRRAEVDQVMVGGDVVPGPMPRETLACLAALDIPTQFIRGNGEVAVLAQMAGRELGSLPERAREAVHWTAAELRHEYQQMLGSWPLTVRIEIHGLGSVLFCHATPRNENEIFTRVTPEERVRPAFASVHAPVVVCGHTHMQFDRMIGDIRVVNAGSVGMPFGESGAYWLLLGPAIELRRTVYDFKKAAERIRATNYPQAEEFAERNVMRPPAEREMLELFSCAELK